MNRERCVGDTIRRREGGRKKGKEMYDIDLHKDVTIYPNINLSFFIQFLPGRSVFNSSYAPNQTIRVINCERHIISSFILLDILLLASYLFGLYLFSRGETEYLSNLAEKVRSINN